MLTSSERRGALIVIALLALGTSWDLWHAAHPDLREIAASGPREAGSVPRPTRPTPAAPESARARADLPSRGRGKPVPARPIDLNRAGADEFHALPGIGPVLARRIVEYRSLHGAFTSIEELLAVRGIGPHLFERIRPYVRV